MRKPEFPVQIDLSLMEGADLDGFQKIIRNLSRNSIYFDKFMLRKFHIPKGYVSWDEFVGISYF